MSIGSSLRATAVSLSIVYYYTYNLYRDARYERLKRPKSEASDVEAGGGTATEIELNGSGSASGDPENTTRTTQGLGVNGSPPGDTETDLDNKPTTVPGLELNGTAPGDQEDIDIRPRRAAGTQDQTDSRPACTEEDEKVVCACSYMYALDQMQWIIVQWPRWLVFLFQVSAKQFPHANRWPTAIGLTDWFAVIGHGGIA